MLRQSWLSDMSLITFGDTKQLARRAPPPRGQLAPKRARRFSRGGPVTLFAGRQGRGPRKRTLWPQAGLWGQCYVVRILSPLGILGYE